MRKIFIKVCFFLSITGHAELARPGVQEFFTEMETKGIGKGVFMPPEPSNHLVTQLVAPLTSDLDCTAVFCVDGALREKIRSEREKGRLVMLTHAYDDLNGAVPSDEWEEIRTFKQLFSGINPKLSLLIISPSTTRDILEHELTHAADFESHALVELYTLARRLAGEGKMAENNAGAITRFVLELRAYEKQRVFVEINPREVEFLYRGGAKSFAGDWYRQGRLRDINYKVLRQYLPRVLKALADPLLSPKDREELTTIMSRLMPQSGPYTFDKLIKI